MYRISYDASAKPENNVELDIEGYKEINEWASKYQPVAEIAKEVGDMDYGKVNLSNSDYNKILKVAVEQIRMHADEIDQNNLNQEKKKLFDELSKKSELVK